MEVIDRPLAALHPYQGNARTHSPAQIDQLCASIREFGWTNPVLTVGDQIVAGHGRLQAAVKLGRQTVPCIDLAGLSEEQARAYLLADNRLALSAGWNAELLRIEIRELPPGLVQVTGFDAAELDALFAAA